VLEKWPGCLLVYIVGVMLMVWSSESASAVSVSPRYDL